MLLIGGAGCYGREVARLLTDAPEITELILAGRDLAMVQSLAAALGEKASAARLDLSHAGELGAIAADVDLVVNAAGPERLVVLPALRETIAAGVDYCDIGASARVTIEARRLDSEARDAHVTALLGVGEFPGLSNLTMLRAAQALDAPQDVHHCVVYVPANKAERPAERLERWRKSGRVDASWQNIMRSFASPVPILRNGRIVEVEPADEPTTVTLASGVDLVAYPVGFSEPVTLRDALPGLPAASTLWSFLPSSLNERALELGAAIARGELDESEAAIRCYEGLVSRASTPGELQGLRGSWALWAEATGVKDGRQAIARCAARGNWATTEGLLCAAALRLLRGEIGRRGVLSPESCLDPLPYLSEAARLAGAATATGELLEERVLTGHPVAPGS